MVLPEEDPLPESDFQGEGVFCWGGADRSVTSLAQTVAFTMLCSQHNSQAAAPLGALGGQRWR